MHYTTDLTAAELEKVHPGANGSAANGDAFGKTQGQKTEKIYNDIMEEYRRSPLDAVLILGDLSIDDFDFRHLPENFCKKFKEECMDRLPCPAFAIPGNHDSHPDCVWRDIFGYSREFVIEFGECVFVMLDTFSDLPAKSASGALHTQINDVFLKEALDKYKGKKIFICAHYLCDKTFSDTACRLIRECPDVVCMYRGHTHHSAVIDTDESLGNKRIVDIGGYGYQGMKNSDGKWIFSEYDSSWGWGYQILEVYEDCVKTYHTKVENTYYASNGTFAVMESVENRLLISQ